MQQKPKTFADDDLFGREAYAKFLETLILNSGKNHRDDDMNAYTIAIDSPWGTGKSVFLEKFENMLMEDYPEKIRVVHYNAWQNDFWKNAFEPFADTIFRHDLFWKELADETLRNTSKHLIGAAKNVGIAFLKAQLSSVVDVAYLEKAGIGLLDGLKEEMDQSPNSVGKEYRDYNESIQQLQNAMEDFLKKRLPDGKLVIIIDELDRCRPTFAIDTLEIIKHIVDVPNVVYIFALDVKQLGAAIKQVYGIDTDATGYLMRFFSYYSRMPKAQIESIVSQMLKEIRIGTEYIEVKEFTRIAEQIMLTARDIETISKVYQIMLKTFLGQYRNKQAYKLYWALLCEKYKNPVEFHESLVGHSKADYLLKMLGEIGKEVHGKIWKKQPMENMGFRECSETPGMNREWVLVGVSIDNGKVQLKAKNAPNELWITEINLSEEVSVSGFLFIPDFKRWDDVKQLTPGEFLLQQMEMYNFIPEIQ